MPEITVTIDDQQHRILGDEKTYCALTVPHGTPWVEEVTNPCPVCFPDAKAKKKG